MISESALPALGMSFAAGGSWRMIHTTTANLSLGLIGLHVALYWQWIVNAVRNYIVKPIGSWLHLPQTMPQYSAKLGLAAKQLQKES